MLRVKLYAGPIHIWTSTDPRIVNLVRADVTKRLVKIATAKYLHPKIKEWALAKLEEIDAALEAAQEAGDGDNH